MAIAVHTGVPFTTDVSTFVRYSVRASRSADPRKRAIGDAKLMAKVAGYKVAGIVEAVEQRDATWLVELELRP